MTNARANPTPRNERTRDDRRAAIERSSDAPIIAAVDGSEASATAGESAVELAAALKAPIVFVYVRRGPAGYLGAPFYQRRLAAAIARGRRVLDDALNVAAAGGVEAAGVMLEGSPRRRIAEFASDRRAQLVVVGSGRFKLGRGVSRAIIRAAERPVVVARSLQPPEVCSP